MSLKYSENQIGEVTVCSVTGKLDAMTAPELKKRIQELVDGKKIKVVLNFEQLSLIDSSGVGAIVALLKRLRTEKGDVKLCALAGQPLEIFKLLRLDKAFDSYTSENEAVEAFRVSLA